MGRFDGKTEKATPRKKRDSRRKGQVAKSAEVGVALSLLALMAGIAVLRGGSATLATESRLLFGHVTTGELPTTMLIGSMTTVLLAMVVPTAAIAVVGALVAGVAQTGGRLSPEAVKPKISNLSVKKGLQRFKPSTAGWELVRTTIKLGALVLLLWAPISQVAAHLASARDLGSGLERTLAQTTTILWRATGLAIVLAGADYAWNRRKNDREMKMSKEDVKKEHKDSDGDPLIKAQRRRRAQELSRNRMLRDVMTADVVVTNPTHFAVALRYADGDAAPRVVAKGADHVAAKIRAAAHKHGVLVTEHKPLARSLYRTCKVGQFVPAALYEAVAVVLATAYRRRGRRLA
ncbi:MAG: EscU/YscU/HrcU family type III secretion system export apparatus switch protein [Actinobacteria bacterium]|nr:EscU/YscU/HrcU family type III secretion system export apparatus switch protein [Actinomycetota bacterium]